MTESFHSKNLPMLYASTTAAPRDTGEKKLTFIIDPRRSVWMPRWDLTMVAALAFTAIVTPVEVAFVDGGQYITELWLINRIVDLCFVLDIFLTFNLAFQEPADKGGQWIFNKRTIAINYIKSWFLIDFLSVLPFWTITLDYSDPWGLQVANTTSLVDTSGVQTSTISRGAVLLRVVKLLRMLKLARVLKASRVMSRVLLDVVTNKWEWTFAVIKMIKLFVFLCLYAHWQACVWGLVSSYMQDSGYPNWIAAFHVQHIDTHGGAPPGALDTYVAALYWSVMTLTSIGYGEMTPVNTAERVLCSIYMMASGIMWTWAIGSVAAIATTLDPNSVAYQNTMDSLNYFMRERELPRTMRMTLRDFFANAKRVHQLNDDCDLLDKMSPLLQGTVALAANHKWLNTVWYFRDIGSIANGTDFIALLAKCLVIRSYVGHERLPVGQLYIVRRGLLVKMWRFLGSGKVWGEDMILDNMDLMDHSQAVALTYVEMYTLRRSELEDCMSDFPEVAYRVRRASRKILMQRALLIFLCQKAGKPAPKSIPMKHSARGYTTVPQSLSLENKVDSILARLGDEKSQARFGEDSKSTTGGAATGAADPELRRTVLAQKEEIASMKHDMAEIKGMMQQLLSKS